MGYIRATAYCSQFLHIYCDIYNVAAELWRRSAVYLSEEDRIILSNFYVLNENYASS